MATTSQRRSTALVLIQSVMKSMSLTVPSTIAGATDKKTLQFWTLATDAGQKLSQNEHKWQVMNNEWLLPTVIGQAAYTLPSDFGSFFEDSQWNRTTRLPVLGGLSEMEWQMLKARNLAGTTFTLLFRVVGDQIVFMDTPTSVQTIALPYTSRGWVQDASNPATRKDNLENDGDIILFDPQLFKDQLKLRWYEEKGFDTTLVERNFQRTLARVAGADSPGRIISIGGGRDYPYLGMINVPDSGYGL